MKQAYKITDKSVNEDSQRDRHVTQDRQNDEYTVQFIRTADNN